MGATVLARWVLRILMSIIWTVSSQSGERFSAPMRPSARAPFGTVVTWGSLSLLCECSTKSSDSLTNSVTNVVVTRDLANKVATNMSFSVVSYGVRGSTTVTMSCAITVGQLDVYGYRYLGTR
jgi:hypothetical protein